MSDSYNRVTFVEHPFSMLVAAILLTIINKYLKKNETLALKVVFMGVLALLLFGYAFPWAKVFGA
jgi:ABC-type bacteriocin/lantibiotic exporter with double-glycine peptidase domain